MTTTWGKICKVIVQQQFWENYCAKGQSANFSILFNLKTFHTVNVKHEKLKLWTVSFSIGILNASFQNDNNNKYYIYTTLENLNT